VVALAVQVRQRAVAAPVEAEAVLVEHRVQLDPQRLRAVCPDAADLLAEEERPAGVEMLPELSVGQVAGPRADESPSGQSVKSSTICRHLLLVVFVFLAEMVKLFVYRGAQV
jgi:hypothetical protein